MRFCSHCGAEQAPDAKFCAACGASTNPGAGSPQSNAPAEGQGRDQGPSILPPPAKTKSGGLGLILPGIVIAALLVIGYLTLGPRSTPTQTAASQPSFSGPTQNDRSPARDTDIVGQANGRRAVDDASDTADTASRHTLGTPTYVSATTLDTAFFSNPSEAALRYPAPLRVSGIMSAPVQTGLTPSVFVEGRTRLNSLIIDFPAGYEDHLVSLYKGKSINVACDGVKSLGGTTILTGCLLI